MGYHFDPEESRAYDAWVQRVLARPFVSSLELGDDLIARLAKAQANQRRARAREEKTQAPSPSGSRAIRLRE